MIEIYIKIYLDDKKITRVSVTAPGQATVAQEEKEVANAIIGFINKNTEDKPLGRTLTEWYSLIFPSARIKKLAKCT